MKPDRAIATFDSATGMLRALGQQLDRRDVPSLGQLPSRFELPASAVLGAVNRLPARRAGALYTASGIAEATVMRGGTLVAFHHAVRRSGGTNHRKRRDQRGSHADAPMLMGYPTSEDTKPPGSTR